MIPVCASALRLPAVVVVFTLSVAGCSWHERHCVPSELNQAGALAHPGDSPKPGDPGIVDALSTRLKVDSAFKSDISVQAPGKKILVLSSGGKFGAYAVGVLSGWTASGTRPSFDVVTGISTGALIASHAFLGPEYDPRLIDLYTSVRSKDVYSNRLLLALLWSDSAASSTPLKHLIDDEITDDMLTAVAAAHAAGRRLYIGTTNLDTSRLVVWDMGAIASSGRPDAKDLYRKIVLASASVPGLLPPVPIDVEIDGTCFTELHVDGGAATSLFLRPAELPVDRRLVGKGMALPGDSDAYIILSGRLFPDPRCARRTVLGIGAISLDTLVASQTRNELFRVYTLCLLSGTRFHLSAIPEELPSCGSAMVFDPVQMQRLFNAGYQRGLAGNAWHDHPPGDDTDGEGSPRRGTEFTSGK